MTTLQVITVPTLGKSPPGLTLAGPYSQGAAVLSLIRVVRCSSNLGWTMPVLCQSRLRHLDAVPNIT